MSQTQRVLGRQEREDAEAALAHIISDVAGVNFVYVLGQYDQRLGADFNIGFAKLCEIFERIKQKWGIDLFDPNEPADLTVGDLTNRLLHRLAS
jgi:hypothetical protein